MEDCVNEELDAGNQNYLIEENDTEVNDKEGDDSGVHDKEVDESTETESATSEGGYEKHKRKKTSFLNITLVVMMLLMLKNHK